MINGCESKVFQSTYLHSARYQPSTNSLIVRFADGTEYISGRDVPREVWDKLRASKSAGGYFKSDVEPYWEGTKLT
jgi:hypothetical protein